MTLLAPTFPQSPQQLCIYTQLHATCEGSVNIIWFQLLAGWPSSQQLPFSSILLSGNYRLAHLVPWSTRHGAASHCTSQYTSHTWNFTTHNGTSSQRNNIELKEEVLKWNTEWRWNWSVNVALHTGVLSPWKCFLWILATFEMKEIYNLRGWFCLHLQVERNGTYHVWAIRWH